MYVCFLSTFLSNRTPKIKFWLKICTNVTGYNAWQFITKFLNKGWTNNSINRLLVKFGTVHSLPGSGRRSAHTDESVDTVESLLLSQGDNPRATEQSEKFHVRREIHRSSVSRIIHKDLRLKRLQEKARSTADSAHGMPTHVRYAVWETTSKPTWKPRKLCYRKDDRAMRAI